LKAKRGRICKEGGRVGVNEKGNEGERKGGMSENCKRAE